MRSFPGHFRKWRSASTFVVAAQLLMVGDLLSFNSAAQQAGNAQQRPPESPPVPAVFQNPIPSDQLAFLNGYAGKMPKEAMKDKRFRNLWKQATPRTTYHYGRDMPLTEASETLLTSEGLPIDVREDRYVMVGSHGGSYLQGRGFIWFDMKEGIALGGVFFHPVNGEPTPTLAIFSRQLKDTSLSMGQLPPAFAEDLAQWELIAKVPAVSPRYFNPDNGRKYVLLHDEDYCVHPADAPAPPQDHCQEMNAEAADADLNAAYFMQETHNAANATAWMLDPDQTAWISFRDQNCGIGPDRLPCRIRITRERTRVILRKN